MLQTGGSRFLQNADTVELDLMYNSSNPKSIISMLNYVHLRFTSSVYCPNPPTPKRNLQYEFYWKYIADFVLSHPRI
jgi:hypothetical protein